MLLVDKRQSRRIDCVLPRFSRVELKVCGQSLLTVLRKDFLATRDVERVVKGSSVYGDRPMRSRFYEGYIT